MDIHLEINGRRGRRWRRKRRRMKEMDAMATGRFVVAVVAEVEVILSFD